MEGKAINSDEVFFSGNGSLASSVIKDETCGLDHEESSAVVGWT